MERAEGREGREKGGEKGGADGDWRRKDGSIAQRPAGRICRCSMFYAVYTTSQKVGGPQPSAEELPRVESMPPGIGGPQPGAAEARSSRPASPLVRALRRLQPELERSIFNCARTGAAGRSFAPRRSAVRVPQVRFARPFRKLRPEGSF